MAAARLSIDNLHKSFSVPVLTDISLAVEPGEIHGIVGENGAGKTTLGNILAGFTGMDSGRITLDGAQYNPVSPKDAFEAGVSCATQELSLIDTLGVAENIAIRNLPQRYSVIAREKLQRHCGSLLETVGLARLDPDTRVGTLGLADRQLVEIAKSISMDCRLLILDEPSAALTPGQTAHLHGIITRLAASGCSVIYISHRLQDVLEVCDTVTILRDGRVVKTAPADTLNVTQLVAAMSGAVHPVNTSKPSVAPGNATPALEVEKITTSELPDEISFNCYPGEIIGIAGLSGAGRSELLNALFGLSGLTGGQIRRHTAHGAVTIASPGTAKRTGMAYLGEDRQSMGLYSRHSILLNMMIPGNLHGLGCLARVDKRGEKSAGDRFVEMLAIRCNSLTQEIDQLSGGNQQKTLIARWLHCNSEVFLFDEPTRGIDVGARNMIYNLLFELRDNHKTLLITSSEIEELMGLCNRILVLSNRKLVREFDAGNWSETSILAACFSEFTAQTAAAEPRATM